MSLEWMERAACRAHDPEMWWALPGSAEAVEAQEICLTGCPVRAECLAYAYDHGEPWGIWGGLTDAERRRALVPARYAEPAREAHRPPKVEPDDLAELVRQGLGAIEIAERLHVHVRTVQRQRRALVGAR